jgi:hypothetical protein
MSRRWTTIAALVVVVIVACLSPAAANEPARLDHDAAVRRQHLVDGGTGSYSSSTTSSEHGQQFTSPALNRSTPFSHGIFDKDQVALWVST